ncbi:hypothetical protein [Bacillus cereus]
MKDYMLSNEYRKGLNEKTIGALQAQVKDLGVTKEKRKQMQDMLLEKYV